jgi:hypothetical protein
MRADHASNHPRGSRRNRAVLIAALAGVLVLVTGTAYGVSQSQSQSPTLHACSAKSTGALRLVAAGSKCKSSEKTVYWNVQGPRGLKGSPGSDGTDGVSNYKFVHEDEAIDDGFFSAQNNLSVPCPDGTTVLGGGGGFRTQGSGPNVTDTEIITYSTPLDDASGWQIGYRVDYGDSGTSTSGLSVRVYAICGAVDMPQ